MDWTEKHLGDFAPFIYGKGLPKEKRIDGDVPVYGSNGIVGSHNQALLSEPAVIIGRTTLSRSINALIASAKLQIVIDPRIATVDSDRLAAQRFTQLPSLSVLPGDVEYREKWQKYAARAVKSLAEVKQWSEPIIARQIAAALPAKSTLFISSSRPIRDIEGFALPRTGIETFANRGLAGIDGNISTALLLGEMQEKNVLQGFD
jgi:2-succinyl-5-enolpyruvyl-6-hydroxy-3-cyclohexene-1-carboxylate synthase